MGSGEDPAKAEVCALRLMLGMFIDSGEVLRGGNLLSHNSINGAGDKVPRGIVVLSPVSALVGVLLSDREVMEGELGMFHLRGSSACGDPLVWNCGGHCNRESRSSSSRR